MLAMAAMLLIGGVRAEGLNAERLGVIYSLDDSQSREVALYYATQRAVPYANVIGLHLPGINAITPEAFAPLRAQVLDQLPAAVQSLVLIWSKPYAVGCMSITSAFAAGYRPEFCQPGCTRTPPNPLFDGEGWLPADTVGWWPSMLLPSADPAMARALIQRGMAADFSAPPGTLYLIRTSDEARDVRAASYPRVELELAHRLRIAELSTPIRMDLADAIGYFTGARQVAELSLITRSVRGSP